MTSETTLGLGSGKNTEAMMRQVRITEKCVRNPFLILSPLEFYVSAEATSQSEAR
jgi:hypothetical protein